MQPSIHRSFIFTLAVCLMIFAGCKTSAPTTNSTTSGTTQPVGQTSSGNCYNAYYPATATLKKTYKITYESKGMPPTTYTESFGNLTSDGFVQTMEFAPTNGKAGTDVKVESGVKCTPEGLAILEYGNLTAGQNLKYKYKTIKTNGVSFPNESEWQIGKKWQMAYDVEGEMTEAPIAAMKMAPKGTVTIQCEILNKESMTVTAGTYDTFRVAMTFNSNLKMNMMGREIPVNMSFKSNVWYAKDVGMVKTSIDEFKATTELVALTK